jgi:hypothetical protein
MGSQTSAAPRAFLILHSLAWSWSRSREGGSEIGGGVASVSGGRISSVFRSGLVDVSSQSSLFAVLHDFERRPTLRLFSLGGFSDDCVDSDLPAKHRCGDSRRFLDPNDSLVVPIRRVYRLQPWFQRIEPYLHGLVHKHTAFW